MTTTQKPSVEIIGKTAVIRWNQNGEQYVHKLHRGSLLGGQDSNAKLETNERPTKGLSMTPHIVRGLGAPIGNVCPYATIACAAACLVHTGNGRLDNVQKGRLARRLFWQFDRKTFYAWLQFELAMFDAECGLDGVTGLVRLNVFSDIRHELYIDLSVFSNLLFYGYTKWPPHKRSNRAPNHHLTYSYTGEGDSLQIALDYLAAGGNVAVVFADEEVKKRTGKWAHLQPLPAEWNGYPVIDGSITDDRTTDPAGSVVGLVLRARSAADRREALRTDFVQLVDSTQKVLAQSKRKQVTS